MSAEPPSSKPPQTYGAMMQRIFVFALLACIGLLAIGGAVFVFYDTVDPVLEQLFSSLATLGGWIVLLLVFTMVMRRDLGALMRCAMIVGIVASAIATSLFLDLIHRSYHYSAYDHYYDVEERLARWAMGFSALAVALAYTGALSRVRTKSWLIRGVAIGTGLSVWAAAGLIVLVFAGWDAMGFNNSFDTLILLAVTIGILCLITLTGTIAVPVALLSKAAKRSLAAESIDPRVKVHLGCPKCAHRQLHRPGFSRCEQCGVSLFIEIEEPRCE